VHRQVQPALSGRAPGLPARAGTPRTQHVTLALLLGVWLGALCVDLATRPVSTTAEQRCLDVMREMAGGGDWIVPRRDGSARLHKPPLAYWTASAVAVLTGRDDLFALRLPSVLASAGLVLVTFLWGRAAGGARAGLAAAAALMLMQSVFALGRRGVAEMQLALCCNLALYVFLRLQQGERRAALLPAFAACLAGAVLAKATVALLVIGLPVAVALTWRRRWRDALRPSVALWVAAGLLPGLAWYAAVLARVPGASRTLHAQLVLPLGLDVDEAVLSADHAKPAWAYLRLLLGAAAPAVLAAPWALRRAVATRCWRATPALRLAALTFVSLLVAFSLVPGKQKHYLLPLLPSLALLLGASAVELADAVPGWAARRVRVVGLAGAALGRGRREPIGLALDSEFGPGPAAAGAWFVGGSALVVGLAAAAWRRRVPALLVLLLVLDLGAQIVYARTYDVWRQRAGGHAVQHASGHAGR
jgi:4-amino-4-deoxy-L-arabinose transferase-like glycosyltransferase